MRPMLKTLETITRPFLGSRTRWVLVLQPEEGNLIQRGALRSGGVISPREPENEEGLPAG